MADKHARPQLGEVTDLHVHESGTPGSPAIVFLHGVGNSGGMWASHMAGLTGYHCLAPDLPGFGRSNRVPWRSRIHTTELVADLIAHRVPARQAHVVSLSLGGSVAHTLLAKRPELLDRGDNGSGVQERRDRRHGECEQSGPAPRQHTAGCQWSADRITGAVTRPAALPSGAANSTARVPHVDLCAQTAADCEHPAGDLAGAWPDNDPAPRCEDVEWLGRPFGPIGTTTGGVY